jgi:two-component system, response regulator, stage 0 sporulation protein F
MTTRVLVIDDSLTVRRLIEIAVRNRPVTVEFASNGADAIASILKQPPDMIFLDYVLPDMNGVELCRELERRGAKAVPIVVISGNKDKIRGLFGFYPKVVDFMSKPFGAADVHRILATFPAQTATQAPEGTSLVDANEVFSATVLRTDVFRLLSAAMRVVRNGEVLLSAGAEQISIFVREEHMVMVSTRNVDRYREVSRFDVSRVAPSVMLAAQKEQERTAQPFIIPLAAYFPEVNARTWIYKQGLELLKRALWGPLASSRLSMRALRSASHPEFLATYASVLSVAQLDLVALRESRQMAIEIDEEGTVSRVPGFAHRLAEFDPSTEERGVLLAFTGRGPVTKILAETRVEKREALLALSRLVSVGLLAYEPPGTTRTGSTREALILIADSDKQGVELPLAHLLRERAAPLRVHALGAIATWFEHVQRQRPTAVIVNVDEAQTEGEQFARAVRRDASLNGLGLIAIADRVDPGRTRWLRSAGFDVAIEKPIHISALEPYLIP